MNPMTIGEITRRALDSCW